MLLEEVFEGMGIYSPKEVARQFVEDNYTEGVSDVDWLDHLCDLEFILHGSKAKLGLTPQQDAKSIHVVLTANNQKLHAGQDSHGKQQKPADFVGPEAQLQKILDERNS